MCFCTYALGRLILMVFFFFFLRVVSTCVIVQMLREIHTRCLESSIHVSMYTCEKMLTLGLFSLKC
jgi:hypothetical protein